VLPVSVRARLALGRGGCGWLDAGDLDGVGGPVVLAVLPDDRILVVVAAVVDSDADAEDEGGLPVADSGAAAVAALVGGDAELGVGPVEGLLGVPLGLGLLAGAGGASGRSSRCGRRSLSAARPAVLWLTSVLTHLH
jgi:hypothetical protein